MTRFCFRVFFIFAILFLLFGGWIMANADNGSFGRSGANGYVEGRRWASVLITGDGSGNGVGIIAGSDLKMIKNHYIQDLFTNPGSGSFAPSAYTGTMTDEWGRSVVISERSTSVIQTLDVPTTMGRNWAVVGNLTITLTGIGQGKTVLVTILVH